MSGYTEARPPLPVETERVKLHGRIRVAPVLSAAIERLLAADDAYDDALRADMTAVRGAGGNVAETYEKLIQARREKSDARIELIIMMPGGRP